VVSKRIAPMNATTTGPTLGPTTKSVTSINLVRTTTEKSARDVRN